MNSFLKSALTDLIDETWESNVFGTVLRPRLSFKLDENTSKEQWNGWKFKTVCSPARDSRALRNWVPGHSEYDSLEYTIHDKVQEVYAAMRSSLLSMMTPYQFYSEHGPRMLMRYIIAMYEEANASLSTGEQPCFLELDPRRKVGDRLAIVSFMRHEPNSKDGLSEIEEAFTDHVEATAIRSDVKTGKVMWKHVHRIEK